MHWAAAIEVLHNASLIHDDICDGDRLRRGTSGCMVGLWA
jgi:geranylgeranyl pyrophosphate synthase